MNLPQLSQQSTPRVANYPSPTPNRQKQEMCRKFLDCRTCGKPSAKKCAALASRSQLTERACRKSRRPRDARFEISRPQAAPPPGGLTESWEFRSAESQVRRNTQRSRRPRLTERACRKSWRPRDARFEISRPQAAPPPGGLQKAGSSATWQIKSEGDRKKVEADSHT